MTELNAKQMRQLLQSISTDPQLKQSKDSILLAEDQYPEVLDAVFARLTHPTKKFRHVVHSKAINIVCYVL
jgi:hypothetical protein